MVNEWTRDDLPSPKSVERNADNAGVWIVLRDAEFVLDVVVEHLNRTHQKPDPDRWCRANEIMEGERDLARDRCRELERERDGAMQARNTALVLVSQAQDERDEALDRAEAAEARTAPAVSPADVEQAIRAEFRDEGFYLKTPVEYRVFRAVCDLLPVEDGQDVDPVEAKVRELADVMNQAIADERIEWHTAPAAVDALASRLAAHILGQEADL